MCVWYHDPADHSALEEAEIEPELDLLRPLDRVTVRPFA
jgi:hypothetical protein